MSRSPPKWEEKQNTLLNRRKRKLIEKSGPWDYRNRSIWEKYFPRGQMPSARQKHHQTVSMKLADFQDSCRMFVLTSRSDHVIVYATAKLIMDGGLPNYRPTRLNDSGNFFRPDDFSTFLFFILIRPIMHYTRVYYWVSSWWANRIGLASLTNAFLHNFIWFRCLLCQNLYNLALQMIAPTGKTRHMHLYMSAIFLSVSSLY